MSDQGWNPSDATKEPNSSTLTESTAQEPELPQTNPITPRSSAADSPTVRFPDSSVISQTGRRVGDYELLEEIARGGMGIVYRARQLSLNRTVALKMILVGQLASPEDLRRFRAEAQAAACLKHPNIVAIHEVGEHDGQHFFSMDFVDGRSLASIGADGPLANERAARYAAITARAVHYAHGHKVLHRDLKPSNVIIDENDQPQITDFGLAKRVGEAGITLTGVVMGTPGFMPPEQSRGEVDKLGPATDVYALGAILYALLTGRPPFVASSPVLTILASIEKPPVPPRQINPAVDPMLENICLRCLEKDPANRYATAELIVQELQRFLDQSSTAPRGSSGATQPATYGAVENAGDTEEIGAIVTNYERAWSSAEPPILAEFLPIAGPQRLAVLTRLAPIDLAMRWRRGEHPKTESYLSAFRELASDSEACVRLVIQEFLARRKAGLAPSPNEFCQRFAALGPKLAMALDLAQTERGETTRPADESPGAPTASRSAGFEAGKMLGEYRIIREIGRGGMGVVYEAEQRSLHRSVAIKVLPPGIALDELAVERFHREAESSAQVQHPNIVRVFSVGSEMGYHYYVMEYVDGRSLAEVISEMRAAVSQHVAGGAAGAHESDDAVGQILAGPKTVRAGQTSVGRPTPGSGATQGIEPINQPDLPKRLPGADSRRSGIQAALSETFVARRSARWAQITRLIAQLTDALQAAHDKGVIHRDIKPGNLLLSTTGQPLITDFGLARGIASAALTMSGEVAGTPTYMSPEQALGRVHIDHRTDIYSMGATLYEVVTLHPPFDGDREKVLKQIAFKDPPVPRTINPRIPRDLETIILKAMQKDPDRRYIDAAALAADLRRFAEGRPIEARPAGLMYKSWRQLVRLRVPVASAAFVLAFVFGAVWIGSKWRERHREFSKQVSEYQSQVEQSKFRLEQLEEKARERKSLLARLLEDLKSDSAEDRSQAARALGDLQDKEAVEPLIGATHDPDRAVRRDALVALAQLADRRALQVLLDSLNDREVEVRRVVAQALIKLGDRSAVPALKKALANTPASQKEELKSLKGALVRCAGRADAADLVALLDKGVISAEDIEGLLDRSAVPGIITLLEDGNDKQRLEAARLLAEIGDARAAPALLSAVETSEDDTKAWCAYALRNLTDRGVITRLLDTLKKRTKAEEYIARCLEETPHHLAVDVLARLTRENDPQYQGTLLHCLRHAGDPIAVTECMKFISASDERVRDYARYALLAGIHDNAAIAAAFEDLEKDPSTEVRYSTLAYTSGFSHPLVEQSLLRALEDTASRVRTQALTELGNRLQSDAAGKFQVALGDRDPLVKAQAALALGKLRYKPALSGLVALCRDSAPEVRVEAVRALGELGESTAVPALLDALKHADPRTARAAAESLGKLRNSLAVEHLREVLRSRRDVEVKGAAAAAMAQIAPADSIADLIDAAEVVELDADEARLARGSDGTTPENNPRVTATMSRLLDWLPGDQVDKVEPAEIVAALGRFRRDAVAQLTDRLQREAGATERKKAAVLLGELRYQSAVPALVAALHDSDEGVRRAAALALGSVGNPSAAPHLASLLEDPKPLVRRAALVALAQLPLAHAPAQVTALVNDLSTPLRRIATRALSEFEDPTANSALRNALMDDDPRVRREAAIGLARLGESNVVQALVHDLDGANREERVRIARALGRIATPEAIGILSELLESDQPYVARQVVEILASQDLNHTLKLILSALTTDRADLRSSVAATLGSLATPIAAQALVPLIRDDLDSVSRAAAAALGQHVNRHVILADMISGLGSDDFVVRRGSAVVLGRCGSESPAEALLAALKDPAWSVRSSAAIALGQIGNSAAIASLRDAARDPDPAVRDDVVLALGRLRDREGIALLIQGLSDPHPDVRRSSASALALLAERSATEPLVTSLQTADPRMKQTIAFALGEIGGDEAIQELKKLSKDLNVEVARAAISARAVCDPKNCVTDLLELVRSGNPNAAASAATALAEVAGRSVIPQIELLLAESPDLQFSAVGAIGRICQRTDQPVPTTVAETARGLLQDWRRTLHSEPRNHDKLIRVAWTLSALGIDLDEALQCATAAAALKPYDSVTLAVLAETHARRQESSRALETYKKLHALGPVDFSSRLMERRMQEIERSLAIAK